MLITPLPGTDAQQLLRTLTQQANDLQNLQGANAADDLYNRYISWTSTSVRMLRSCLRAGDIDHLVLTRRYWALQTLTAPITPPMRSVITLEIEERITAFQEVQTSLQQQIGHWSQPGVVVVADTSMYLHPDLPDLDELDLAEVLKLRDEPIRLVVPMVVLDELDNQKDRGQGDARGRARRALAVIDRLLPEPTSWGQLRPASTPPPTGTPRGQVSIGLLLDPLGHERLSINDDEIIDRALATTAFADLAGMPARRTFFVTGDTGQSMRARAVGLRVHKLDRRPDNDDARSSRR